MTDDLTLAQKCARRDASAGEELYRRYSSRLLAICRRYCKDKQSAEDTMHDAFVKILENRRKYRYTGEGSLYSWMARLTINLCFDSIAKRRRLRNNEDDNFDTSTIPDTDEQEDMPDIPPEVIKNMIDQLPTMYGTVFKMYVIDELSHAEIGKILGIKEKSSSANLARARMILNDKIREYRKKNLI